MDKSKELDQFYTNPKIAKRLLIKTKQIIKEKNIYWIEPSAGTGSFSDLLKKENLLAIDIDPKQKDILKKNFLLDKIEEIEEIQKTENKIITIGNPPFGKKSSIAIKFFNKSAEISEYICFILPKTFKKESIVNQLNEKMHKIYEEEIEKNSFIYKEKTYDVKCVFQIWKKEKTKRKKNKIKKETKLFKFVKKEESEFAIRRVGGLTGKLLDNKDYKKYSESSNYFIKTNETSISKQELKNKIKKNYEKIQEKAKDTVGNPSISRNELIRILEEDEIN
jgi:predicted RNA methylase